MMKKILTGNCHHFLVVVLFPLLMVISGCQTGQYQSNKVELSSSGEFHDIIYQEACSQNLKSPTLNNPALLYREMENCVKIGRFDNAVFFFGLAGSYTWFDAQRVNSQYARSMHSKLLAEAMGNLLKEQKDKLWNHIQMTMNNSEKKQILCRKVSATGAPSYDVDYMLLEKKKVTTDPLMVGSRWSLAVKSYLECA